jgi:hypothetical protein
MASSAGFIVDQWADLFKGWITAFTDQVDQVAAADDSAEQTKAVYDGGGRIVTAALQTVVTAMEVVTLLVEPIEQGKQTLPKEHWCDSVPAAQVHTIRSRDMVHELKSVDASIPDIPGSEVTAEKVDPQPYQTGTAFSILASTNGRKTGVYYGSVDFFDAGGQLLGSYPDTILGI